MKLPGNEIEEIREALKSAFPRRQKLLEMLRIKLDIHESEVPNDSDYESVLFQLITKLEREERIIKLIQGASEYLPLNTDLQELSKKFHAKLLSQILAPLEKDYIKQMKQAYFACCPDNWHEDCERPIPDTLKQILANLEDMPQGKIPYSRTVQFVARLSMNAEIPDSTVEELKKWGEQNTNNFSDLLTAIANEKVSRKEQQDFVPTYLIVLVEPSQQQRKKRYFVSAWFIDDGHNYNDFPDKHCKLLAIKQKKSLKEITSLLKYFREKSINYRTKLGEITIVFFLPDELLNHPIEGWKLKDKDELPIPIGCEYRVILRSCKRRGKDYSHRDDWEKKWAKLAKLQEFRQNSSNVISGNFQCWKDLYSQLKQSNAIVLKLSQSPTDNKIFQVIDRVGIPVTLWVRQNLKNLNCQDELDTLLNGAITELPERVKQKRLEAFPIQDKENHIGHHLSLLWEDPYLLPPHIDYATP